MSNATNPDLAELRAAAASLGYVMVPAEPSPEMLEEIRLLDHFSDKALRARYQGMLGVAAAVVPELPQSDALHLADHTIKSRDLLARAMRNLPFIAPRRGEMRWVLVHKLFSHGSTVSSALCREFGHDPDDKVKPR